MSISQMLPEALAAKYREYLKPFEGHTQEILNSRIVDAGLNANGYYVRWDSGWQMCLHTVTLTRAASSYLRGAWVFPASFENETRYFAVHSPITNTAQSTPSRDELGQANVNSPSRHQIYLDVYRVLGMTDVTSGASINSFAFAFGRWK